MLYQEEESSTVTHEGAEYSIKKFVRLLFIKYSDIRKKG
jgi:hypothetical protein